MTIRTAEDLEDVMVRALCWQDADAFEAIEDGLRAAQSCADAGILTRDKGLVIRLANGAEFQLTIVRSERPDTPGYECPDCSQEFAGEGEFVDHMTDEHGWAREDAVHEIETFVKRGR
jgi:hypothetical protein